MSVGSSWPPHLAILFNFQPPSTGVNSSVLASRDFPAIFSDLFPVHHLNKAATRLSTELNSLRTVIPPDSHWINLIPEACRGAQLRQCSPPHTQKQQSKSFHGALPDYRPHLPKEIDARQQTFRKSKSITKFWEMHQFTLEFLPNQVSLNHLNIRESTHCHSLSGYGGLKSVSHGRSSPFWSPETTPNHASFCTTTIPPLFPHYISSKCENTMFRPPASSPKSPEKSCRQAQTTYKWSFSLLPPPSEPGFYFRTTEAPHSGADIAYTISCSREQVKFYALPSKFDFWTSGELHYGSIIRSLNFQKLRLWRVVKAAKPKFNFSRSRKSCMYSAFFPAADALRIIHSSKAVKILCRRREPTARRNWPVHFDFSTSF
ncbi:hypothetical protein C8R43DRAFT_965566 [Mycena crocata]|nr:hypothetical protein C8R43DRAFT_965566 [Mycena crocata]